MQKQDAKIVQSWYGGMGGISKHDLDVALAVFPQNEAGFYVGEYEGKVVASAIRIPWGKDKDVFYGSYYYVEAEYRGKVGLLPNFLKQIVSCLIMMCLYGLTASGLYVSYRHFISSFSGFWYATKR